jgi:hypothetical protein
MSQSKSLQTRRKKQKIRKHLATVAKRAKKLAGQNGKTAGAGGLKKGSP